MLVPVYSSAQGFGSGATYTLAGFAAIQLDGPSPPAVTSVGRRFNLNGTFLTAVGPNGAGDCGGASGNFGVTTVYLVG